MGVMKRLTVAKRSTRSIDMLLFYMCLIAAASSSFPRSADARKSKLISRGMVTEGSTSSDLVKYSSKKVVAVNHEKEPSPTIFKRLDVTSSTNSPPLIGDINEHDDENIDSSSSPITANNNAEPYAVSSPFSLPPFDSLAPIPLPESSSTSPFCEYPPSTPNSPLSTSSAPPAITGNQSPPSPIEQGGGDGTYTPSSPPFSIGTPPILSPIVDVPNLSPPSVISSPPPPPSIDNNIPNPPNIYFDPPPSPFSGTNAQPPPNSFISPPSVPNYGFTPTPPVFQPPVVYPPPKNGGPSMGALWCVAKASVPGPIIQEAMNYACGSGADCDSLQPNQPCFEPNTLYAHASYAFNSYWQRTKVAGGTCEFGGTAMLVTVDPSKNGCQYIYY